MWDHGGKGKRDEEGGKKAPPLYTPLWGSPPGGPRNPKPPEGGTVEQSPPTPPAPFPTPPTPPTPPVSEQTLSPRISLPPPVKPRRLKPRELRKKPTPEPRLPHAFDDLTPWYLKGRRKMKQRSWAVIIIAVGVLVLVVTLASSKSKTTTTTSRPGTNSTGTSTLTGKEISVNIEYPTEGLIITSSPMIVKGKAVNSYGQAVSYAGVVIFIDEVEKARSQTREDGSFSVPLALNESGNNSIKVFVGKSAMEGTAFVNCVFQEAPPEPPVPVEPTAP